METRRIRREKAKKEWKRNGKKGYIGDYLEKSNGLTSNAILSKYNRKERRKGG